MRSATVTLNVVKDLVTGKDASASLSMTLPSLRRHPGVNWRLVSITKTGSRIALHLSRMTIESIRHPRNASDWTPTSAGMTGAISSNTLTLRNVKE